MQNPNIAPDVDRSFLDPNLPVAARAECLVRQMTAAEKVSQIIHDAPAIERLGVPAYNWWNECLHGVARAGKATVFPQAIGMAASFDAPLLGRVADATADEARAKHHQAVRQNHRAHYFGLTFWTPNINLFRDPRWGRGQETYGEDPYLTSRLGVAFVRGLQGDNPRYLKLAATAKHYCVHSGPEKDRHQFNAVVSPRDLRESYLRAFRACVVEGRVEAVMGAYNRVNGELCCASPTLLQKVLRDEWGFKGHVVADCWAIRDFHEWHKLTADMAESVALAVREGCDLNCGCGNEKLAVALQRGILDESHLDASLRRLFATRLKLGMFDPEELVPFASIPASVVHCDDHVALARQMARESFVLLKNNGILPLAGRLNRVLVVGPNAKNYDALVANYYGFAPQMVTPFDGILERLSVGAHIDYCQGCDLHQDLPIQQKELDWYLDKQPDAIIAVLGNTSLLEGEENDAALSDGGGDRARLRLPGRQQQMLEYLVGTGRPVVLVVMGGSNVDLSWAQQHCAAVLFAWYPGEQGGHALADVLFGDYSPAGRLPVTFYRSLDQLPPFADYNMKGHTYRFFEGQPLYPFGHGLSYTRFAYRNLRLARPEAPAGTPMRATVEVENIGPRASDEVVQLYLSHRTAPVPVPRLQLEGFKRIHLKPGERRELQFDLAPEQLVYYDDDGQPVQAAGEWQISIGGGQPGDPAGGAVQTTLRWK